MVAKLVLLFAAATVVSGMAQTRPRGRDLGIPFPGQTGRSTRSRTLPAWPSVT